MQVSIFKPPHFENEAYNIPEQHVVRVFIWLPTNKTFAKLLRKFESAILDDVYSCSRT